MDWCTSYLLGRAVEACEGRGLRLTLSPPGVGYTEASWHVTTHAPYNANRPDVGICPTLADALMALLDDLGVDYEARPSEERVAQVRDEFHIDMQRNGRRFPGAVHDSLCDLYAREPLTVLALLSGGDG